MQNLEKTYKDMERTWENSMVVGEQVGNFKLQPAPCVTRKLSWSHIINDWVEAPSLGEPEHTVVSSRTYLLYK